MSILDKHLGHTLTVRDGSQARCETCSHTLDLRSVGATSTSYQPPRTTDDRCALHIFEYAGSCRGCAADRKASA